MIINILSGRRPLYFVHEFYEDMDLPPLFGRGVKAEDFEDHSLARALDKLSQANAKKVFRSVTLQALTPEQVAIGRLHGDTTSWTLTGVFDEGEDTPPDWLRVTKGYNKDHQPGSMPYSMPVFLVKVMSLSAVPSALSVPLTMRLSLPLPSPRQTVTPGLMAREL